MNRSEFTKKVKEAGLTKKEFAAMIGVNYGNVLGWGRKYVKKFDNSATEQRVVKIPVWIDSWLDNYKKAKKFDELKKIKLQESNLVNES